MPRQALSSLITTITTINNITFVEHVLLSFLFTTFQLENKKKKKLVWLKKYYY